MTVIVEGLSLVARNDAIEGRFAGGRVAFVARMHQTEGVRFICADRDLMSVCFVTREAAIETARALSAAGLVRADAADPGDFTLVEEHDGLTDPCAWLAWVRPDGRPAYAFMRATAHNNASEGLAGIREPEHLARPARDGGDGVDDEGRLRMCEENGVVTWLDLRTGTFIVEPVESRVSVLRSLILAALDEREYRYTPMGDNAVTLDLRNGAAVFGIQLTVDDPTGLILCLCRFGSFVPPHRRVETAEALNRANFRLAYGSFDLDFSDGEVRFRFSVDVEHTQRTTGMILTILSRSLYVCERYHDAIMQVAFGGAEPESAIAGVPAE